MALALSSILNRSIRVQRLALFDSKLGICHINASTRFFIHFIFFSKLVNILGNWRKEIFYNEQLFIIIIY